MTLDERMAKLDDETDGLTWEDSQVKRIAEQEATSLRPVVIVVSQIGGQ